MRRMPEQRRFIAVFLAPALVLFTIFVAIPSIRALGYSLQKWDGLGTPEWVGLKNFATLFQDSDLFLTALRHNLFIMAVGGGCVLSLSLFFAALLHRRIRGAAVFRVAFFFPNVISAVAIAVLWTLLYSTTDFGVVNAVLLGFQRLADDPRFVDLALAWGTGLVLFGVLCVLGYLVYRSKEDLVFSKANSFTPYAAAAGMTALMWVTACLVSRCALIHAGLDSVTGAMGWQWPELPFPFVDSKYLIYSIIPMMVWTATGFYMVLFLAAMENIPETFYEAAKIDGASAFAQFRHITLPLIREVLTVGLIFIVIGTLKFFDAIWVMENQWPTKDSHVLATVLYQKVFTEYNVGYGSAVAVLLFILVFLATLLTLRLSRKEALEY